MSIRTLNFLPTVFQTTTNQKFLNATLDQLVSEPNFKKVNGYVGRKFAPTFKSSDNYLPEPTADRKNYQLEPSVVVQDVNKNVNFFSSYMDLIQQIQYYGGDTTNHSRLFSNEAYSFNGCVDFDKLVNFNQYYWMPTGPDAVDVFPGNVDDSRSYTMTKNSVDQAYRISGYGSAQNPTIYVARGGSYEFLVNQDSQFWIQTDPGLTGTRYNQRNINTREVFGVTNNGASNGVITFDVPQINAQDEFINMPEVRGPLAVPTGTPSGIDYGTMLDFNDVDNMSLELIPGGIDGETNPTNLHGKYLVFLSGNTSDEIWDERGIYAFNEFGVDSFDEGTLIPRDKRGSVWRIDIVDTGAGDFVVNLLWDQVIPINHKVLIKAGNEFANQGYYKNNYEAMVRIPLITAPLTSLYYNDGTNQRYFGRIVIVNKPEYLIEIDKDIIGKSEYLSPNGVTFTNGLKIKFGSSVTPASYANNTYYVEGVGTSIELVKESYLITPELDFKGTSVPFDIYGFSADYYDQNLSGPLTPDYITINRSSKDFNPWSRSNRWVHADVIAATAAYNNSVPVYDQSNRAARPIIEFVANLQLFDNGRTAKHDVNFLDYTITDALNQVEGIPNTYFRETEIKDGMTIVFANDYDPTVRNKIWKINVLDIDGEIKVHLTRVPGGDISEHDVIAPISGTTVNLEPISPEPVAPVFNPPALTMPVTEYDYLNYKAYTDNYDKLKAAWEIDRAEWSKVRNNPQARRMSENNGLGIIPLDGVTGLNTGLLIGRSFWLTGTKWNKGQEKLGVNIQPVFDLVDNDLVSLGDRDKYLDSSFVGCKLFSYKLSNSGLVDNVLGLPISYRNFNNIGDIEFTNNYDSDSFSELVGLKTITHPVNEYFIPKIIDHATIEKINNWDTVVESTRQYQVISNVSTGITSYYEIDILPAAIDVIPTIKVFLNNVLLTSTQYVLLDVKAKKAVRILVPTQKGDKVDIQIYSDSVSNIGYYEVPSNLNFNALNQNFSSLTLGQFRNHLTTIAQNSTKVVGQVPGSSNLRDLNIKNSGGNILQHSAPAVYSSLFLLNKDINFVDSITLAQKEYSRFKNRFLEMYTDVINSGITDPRIGVDYIMSKLNFAKNSAMPWYYSDMIPYDENRTIIEYTVLSLEQTEYEIDKIFNDTQLSNKAILVYLNNVQLVKGVDYTFNNTRQSIIISTELQYDDTLTIYIFNNTDGCYVPETPTKLGLYPKFTPEIYSETTYSKSFRAIRGHDGSVTPVFNDLRDGLLFELEKRIFNNIKSTYDTEVFDIYDHIPGKFRKTDYSRTEFNRIVATSFLPWVGNNRVDYSTNNWFASNNPWSWTYNRFRDVLSPSDTTEYLPGHWRGIYKYFYDTDAPHQRPWECLGFSEQPLWWVEEYGPAPYTGGNLVLWKDLEDGLVRQGPRAGIQTQFVRPGLSRVIPVTNNGLLRNPQEFLVTQFNGMDVSGNFEIGDDAPVESAWRKSSDYPYAVQLAIALMKPGLYFGLLANADHYHRSASTGQYALIENNQRVTPKSLKINGASSSGAITRAAGYLNWVADYVTNNGASPALTISKFLDNLEVRLGYRAAGFTDKSFLRVLAEQSSPTSSNDSIVIPDENYLVHLHKSASVTRLVYSAVIVEKTTAGFSVTGYNTKNPFFTIVPSDPNSNSHTIEVDGAGGTIYGDFQRITVSIPYGHQFTNKQQVVDFLVSYQRYLLSMGFTFDDFNVELGETKNWELSCKEFLTWTQQGWGPGSIIVLSPVSNKVSANTVNAVVDHIDNSPSGSRILDIGFNVIRSSMFNAVRDGSNFSITSFPEITIGLLDLNLVQYEHALIFDNQTVFNDIIYKPELGNRQYRLKLIGNKTDEWAGQLNPPGFIFSNPQIPTWSSGKDYRKGDIVSYKGVNYSAMNGIDASNVFGFGQWVQLTNANFTSGMLPNFAYNAQKFENMYDVDNQVQDQNINKFSNGLIGHRDRNYLTDLSLNSTSQVKFYQGYIKDKGTKDSISALSSAVFNNLSGNVSFNEEWAFRVGEYGATESNQFLEVQLDDSKFTYSPITMALLIPGEEIQDPGVVGFTENFLYKKPKSYRSNIFKNRDASSFYEADSQTAGYVNLNDVDATLFDMNNFASLDTLIPNVHSGYKIWVAKDIDRDWNVYRASETSIRLNSVKYEFRTDNDLPIIALALTFNSPHRLQVNDLFIVKGFSATLDKFYRVSSLTSTTVVEVTSPTELTSDNLLPSLVTGVTGDGAIFKIHSLRVNNLSDIDGYTPAHGWQSTDNVWVDSDAVDGSWAVYNKTTPWTFDNLNSKLLLLESETYENSRLGSSVAVTEDGLLVVTGTPTYGNGAIRAFVKTTLDKYASSYVVDVNNPTITEIGYSMSIAKSMLAVGAPGSDNETGQVLVFDITKTGEVTLAQVVSLDAIALVGFDEVSPGDRFGHSVALSKDSKWLYVGAPGGNKVFALRKVDAVQQADTITSLPSVNSYALSFSPVSTLGVVVRDGANVLIPNRDYQVFKDGEVSQLGSIGDRIEFTITPPTGVVYSVTQGSFYEFVSSLTTLDSELGDNFGYSLDTQENGEFVVVGAPNAKRNSTVNVGKAYVFNRYVQSYVTDGLTSTYVFSETFEESLMPQIFLDDVAIDLTNTVDYAITSTSITFTVVPVLNQQLRIELNHFGDPIQEFQPEELLYNSKFGYSVAMNKSGAEMFISAPDFNSATYHGGVAYKFTNESISMNTIVGKTMMTSYVGSVGVRINNRHVTIAPQATPTQIVDTINQAGIVGLHASNEGGYLKLTFTAPSSATRLTVLNDSSPQGLVVLGMGEIFYETQVIKHPYQNQYERFGTRLVTDWTSDTLLVSSEGAPTIGDTILDSGTTQFDHGLTRLQDTIANTGTVYVFEELINNHRSYDNPAKVGFIQQLTSTDVSAADNFGSAIAISRNRIFVGANYDEDNNVTNSGKVYYFTNPTMSRGWTKLREQEAKVDVYQLSKMYMYDRKMQNILTTLDFFDPIKGKMLGVVEEELTYKTSFDPANYNYGTSQSAAIDLNYHWGKEQVGQVWWNLDSLRYIDYEQSDLTYRINNWGKLFPDSKIVVCEWVESLKPPSQYSGSGTPLYPNDGAYVEKVSVESTGFIRSKYYFWVTGKETVDLNLGFRKLSVSAIADIIASPTTQNIPYAALIKDNAVSVFSGNQYLSGKNTILHIDYAIIQNTNIIHNEYELVPDNSADAIVPDKIINKLVDSITGADKFGHMVPDYKLGAAERYGITIRPRQSMFVNRLEATRNFVEYVNSVFMTMPICEVFDLTKMFLAEEVPFAWGDPTGKNITVATLAERSYLSTNSLETGQLVLVLSDADFFGQWTIYSVLPTKEFKLVRTQSFKTTDYWDKIDWFDPSYNNSIKPTFTINTESEIAKLLLRGGDTIRVKNNGSGQFVVYRVDGFNAVASTKQDSKFFEVVKTYTSANALLQDTTPYGIAVGQFAIIDTGDAEHDDDAKIYRWDGTWTYIAKLASSAGIAGAVGIVGVRDDGNRFYEITKIYSSVTLLLSDIHPEGIVAGQMAYISTGDVAHPEQDKLYLWDGKEYQFVTKLTGTMGYQVRQWQSVTLPNSNVILTLVGLQDGTIALKDSLWAHNTNQIGFDNDNFDTVKYDLNPTVEFRNIIEAIREDIFTKVLDGKFNSLFFILLDYIFSEQRSVDWAFKTSFITVLHRLRKLSQFPNYIKDNQTFYEDYINEVKPYRTKIREYVINYEGDDTGNIVATDFDIPAYYDVDFDQWRSPNGEHARDELLLSTNASYLDWYRNHSYSIDYVNVSKPGVGYSASMPLQLIVTGGGLPDKSPHHAKLEAIIDFYSGALIKVNVLDGGSGYTSTPTILIPGDGIGPDGEQTAVCYPVLKNSTVRSFDTSIKFDRVSYESTVKQWAQDTDYELDDIISYNHKAYAVIAPINSGTFFNPTEYVEISGAALTTAADRVSIFYRPTSTMLPNDLRQLFVGTEYPGNRVDGESFVPGDVVLDTEISSLFTDAQLGLRPEDIDIVGGGFVDVFSSHAPEELLPGLMYDTLDIKVFTVDLMDPLTDPVGYRITKKMTVENRTTFDNNATIFDTGDTFIYDIMTKDPWEFRRISKAHMTRLVQDLHYDDTEIFVEDTDKLPRPNPRTATPGVVYINGEKIIYYDMDSDRNALTQIRRGAWGTGVPLVHRAYVPELDTLGVPIDTSMDILQPQYETLVVDASIEQEMPDSAATSTWLNLVPVVDQVDGAMLIGDGLRVSSTPEGLFIRASGSYLPWAPDQLIDPPSTRSRFDEGPYLDDPYQGAPAQYDPRIASPSHPTHPFDIDSFDSYRIDI